MCNKILYDNSVLHFVKYVSSHKGKNSYKSKYEKKIVGHSGLSQYFDHQNVYIIKKNIQITRDYLTPFPASPPAHGSPILFLTHNDVPALLITIL